MLRIHQYGKQALKLKLLMIWSPSLRKMDSVNEFTIIPAWSISEINSNYKMSDFSYHLTLLSFLVALTSSITIEYLDCSQKQVRYQRLMIG